MKKPKLLFYSGHCEIVGGDAKYLFELVQALADDYDVRVYTDRNPVFAERARQWLQRDIPIHYLDTRPRLFQRGWLDTVIEGTIAPGRCGVLQRLGIRCLQASFRGFCVARLVKKLGKMILLTELRGNLRNMWIFYRLFREHRPDLFHFNNGGYLGKIAGLWAVLMARLAGVRHTVMTIQNLPATKTIRPSDYLYDALMARYCDRFVPVSVKLKDKMVVNRGLPAAHIVPIYHGLGDVTPLTADQVRVLRRELSLQDLDCALMLVSNIDEERKGHRVVLHALQQLQTSCPTMQLLIVGDGTRRALFEALSRELGVQDRVRFLGHRTDIAALNDAIDVALVPSIAFEGIPYTIREAMCSAKPVITTDAGGCDEAVIHGETGLIVPQNDVASLAGAIRTLVKDRELRLRMGRSGRRYFEEKFSLAVMVAAHRALYTQLLGGAQREAPAVRARGVGA